MPYEIIVPSDKYDNGTSELDDGGRAVLIVDSPLSRDLYGALLEVEVIGIFPKQRQSVGWTRLLPSAPGHWQSRMIMGVQRRSTPLRRVAYNDQGHRLKSRGICMRR